MRERVRTTVDEFNGEYTIEVLVGGDAFPFISVVKPLLDGLISALHVHDGSHGDLARATFASYGDSEHLWNRLNDPATAILGHAR